MSVPDSIFRTGSRLIPLGEWRNIFFKCFGNSERGQNKKNEVWVLQSRESISFQTRRYHGLQQYLAGSCQNFVEWWLDIRYTLLGGLIGLLLAHIVVLSLQPLLKVLEPLRDKFQSFFV